MKKYLIAGSVLALSSGAFAQGAPDRGFYIGLNAGQSTVDISKQDLDSIAATAFASNGIVVQSSSSSLDDSATAFSGFLGYRFSSLFALEAGYVDLGTAKYRSTSTVSLGYGGQVVGVVAAYPSAVGLDIAIEGATAGAAFYLPLRDRFDVHLRGGAFFGKVSVTASAALGTTSQSAVLSSTSTDPYFGIGLGWRLTDRLTLAADYTRYQKVGDKNETGEGDVVGATAGLIYRF
jgi:OOP family OmpA-OmpF porin